MKKAIAFLLFLFLLLSTSLAEASSVNSMNKPVETVRGFVIENTMFSDMENVFQQNTFSAEMSAVALSETQTLVFNPKQVDHLLPNLIMTLTDAESFTEDVDTLVSVLGSLIGTMQYLQDQFPDSFLFNDEMIAEYAESGVSYAVSEPEIWLWQESAGAVFIPVCFYENGSGMLVDGIYLLEVLVTDTGSLCYMLYNDSQCVVDYMAHVTIGAGNSPFQQALAFWYLQNHLLIDENS